MTGMSEQLPEQLPEDVVAYRDSVSVVTEWAVRWSNGSIAETMHRGFSNDRIPWNEEEARRAVKLMPGATALTRKVVKATTGWREAL
jgi:hypothetical protein